MGAGVAAGVDPPGGGVTAGDVGAAEGDVGEDEEVGLAVEGTCVLETTDHTLTWGCRSSQCVPCLEAVAHLTT